jgi:hypothetical protein
MFNDWYNERIKNLKYLDMQFIKLSVVAFTLFVVSFLSNYIDKIVALRWLWFLLLILFVIKPFLSIFKKRK